MITPIAVGCLLLGLADSPSPPTDAVFAQVGGAGIQDVVILAEIRPVVIRLRVLVDGRAFRAAGAMTVQAIHAQLDQDHDGKLTEAEATASGLPLFLPPLPPGRTRADTDANPKDGVISVDELAETLGGPAGAFRTQSDGLSDRRTDPLFDLLDRDKDGQLTRPELAAIVGTLRKIDRDDNELIALDEVASAAGPNPPPPATGRAPRDQGLPSAVAIDPGESPLRLIRMLLKKYDTGSSRTPGKPDSKLSPEEFAIPSEAFTRADTNGDLLLNSDELRNYFAQTPIDATVDVSLAASPTGHAVARLHPGDGGSAQTLVVRQLADDVVELDLGLIRLDLHVDDGAGVLDAAGRLFRARFDAADVNKDDYLEEAEMTQEDGQPSPLSSLFSVLDLNHDGKLYRPELDLYVERQATVGRAKLSLLASNQGRALFGLLDLDRDRQLGAREVLDTLTRISVCDRDHDGRVTPDEIPHHIQLTLTRGDLAGLFAPVPGSLTGSGMNALVSGSTARPRSGPDWFRRMDRNRDGDVSRREFLGTHEQYDRLDRDKDGLLSSGEAEAIRPVKGPGG